MSKLYRNIILSALLITTLTSTAKPAYRGIIEREQADGTKVQVLMHGDEHFHYTTDLRGNRIKSVDGKFVKAETLTDEQIAIRRQMSKYNIAQQNQEAQGAYLAPRGLVILANFSDVKFKPENNQAAFDSLMNVRGYTYNGVTNSVRDYFIDQSHGSYNPQFDVFGPVEVNHTMAYYGENDSYDNDKNAEQLIADACKAAKKAYNIDFSEYDNDGDNYVDFVFVFYAGYGEADGADSKTIWQHMYNLQTSGGITCTIDGTTIDLYACGSELAYQNRDKTDNPRDGISTCCHEFSHVCGLPDMYLTSDYSTAYTLGMWDLMDNGTANNNGWTPPAYSAYEKFFCGWLTPTLLNSAADIVLPEQNRTKAAAIITTTGQHNLDGIKPSPTTFYLLENRQQSGWDEYLPGHGLLITKITYNKQAWDYNMVNSGNKQRIAIQPADGKLSELGDGGDTYPGTKGITTYTGVTQFPITDITETDGVIRFKVLGGGEEITLNTTKNIEDKPFDIRTTNYGLIVSNVIEGADIQVYDINGKHICTQKAQPVETTIPIIQQGIYIVSIGTTAKTIVF